MAAGHPSKFPGLPPVFRPVVRVLFLRRVLRKETFPRARASKAFDPVSGPATPAEGRARLDAAHRAFEEACRQTAARGERIPSRIFGRIPAEEYIRFIEIHTRHHLRQMVENS